MGHSSLVGTIGGLILTGASTTMIGAEVLDDQHWVHSGAHAPASAAVGGHFGTDVDSSGGMVIIGAPYQGTDPFHPAGPGYAQLGRLHGSERATTTLSAPDGVDGDLFGLRVLLQPNLTDPAQSPIAMITAPRRSSDSGDALSGAVYNFHPDQSGGASWQQTITPADASAGQMFGVSMDFDGKTLAIGAPRDSTYASVGGTVYLYMIDENGMAVNEQRLDPRIPIDQQFFGFSVDIDGDRLAVGAFADSSYADLGGAVHIFDRQHDGSWLQTARIAPQEVLEWDYFGTAIALQGDVLIASSNDRRVNGLPSVGRVYVFHKIGEEWVQVQSIDPPRVTPSVYWGVSLCLRDDLLAIGANGWTNNDMTTGAASVLRVDGDGVWRFVQTLLADGVGDGGAFGTCVALAEESLLIGAPDFTAEGNDTLHAYAVTCLGDLTGDHESTIVDMIEVISSWDATGISVADLTQDFEVGIPDLLVATGYWGACP
ncbi:MAG: FG-GAP repeat protein [Phycisphaerales bacterium]|nr:FG-GAP repeat protein [Phycisphaerales bacterium]